MEVGIKTKKEEESEVKMENVEVKGINKNVVEGKIEAMTEKQKQEIINNAEAIKDIIKVCEECGVSEMSFDIKRNIGIKVNIGIQIKEFVGGVRIDVENGINQHAGFRFK